jgi:hypothetical protein
VLCALIPSSSLASVRILRKRFRPVTLGRLQPPAVLSRLVVTLLSVVPGLGSLLLCGRSALVRSLLMLFAMGVVPVAATFLPLMLFPTYPSTVGRNVTGIVIWYVVPALILTLSITRGLRDRAAVIASGERPAYKQGWRGLWPFGVALLAIMFIVLTLCFLVLLALSGFSNAK